MNKEIYLEELTRNSKGEESWQKMPGERYRVLVRAEAAADFYQNQGKKVRVVVEEA